MRQLTIAPQIVFFDHSPDKTHGDSESCNAPESRTAYIHIAIIVAGQFSYYVDQA
jgi:hypothetical protein